MTMRRPVTVMWACALALGFVSVTARHASGQCETAVVVPDDVGAADDFAHAVDIDLPFAVAGTRYDDEAAPKAGAAYVYHYVEGTWRLFQKLTASDAQADDRFGEYVALDGNVLAVSAVGDDDLGLFSGAVYIFRFNGTAWVEEAKLTTSTDVLGYGLALQGHRLVAGGHRNDDLADDAGTVYVFEYDGSTWVRRHQLYASGAKEDDFFGAAVALDGNTIMASMRGIYGIPDPEVRVFEYDGAAWNETQVLDSAALDNDLFGQAMAISNGLAAIGADRSDVPLSNAGAVHLFERVDGAWVARDVLIPAAPDINLYFGSAVALDDATLIVGADADDSGGAIGAGSVTVYDRRGAAVEWVAVIYPEVPLQADRMGQVLALDGDIGLAGSNKHAAGNNTGAMHLLGGLQRRDCDGDGTPDACEIGQGLAEDCNANFVPDLCDVVFGTSRDENGNFIPDECVTDLGVYIGPSGGRWHDPANWSGHLVPDASVPVRIETTVVIDAPGAVAATVDLRAGGHLIIDGASLSAATVEVDEDAALTVRGRIHGDVLLDGTLTASSAQQDVVVIGSLLFGPFSRFETRVEARESGIDLAGLVVSEVVVLDGVVAVSIENGERLAWGDASSLVMSALRYGAFFKTVVTGLPAGTDYELRSLATSIELRFIRDETPDPCLVGFMTPPQGISSLSRLGAQSGVLAVRGYLGRGEYRVLVYRHVGAGFELESLLGPPQFEYGLDFGDGLAVAGNMIIVGASGYPLPGGYDGAIFVYVYDADADGPYAPWRLAQKIDASSLPGGYGFGRSIRSDGQNVLVQSNHVDTGVAYVMYRIVGDALEQVAVLTTVDPHAPLAYSFAVEGKWAAIRTDAEGPLDPLQLFRQVDDQTWTPAGVVTAPAGSDAFGSVSMRGDVMSVGDVKRNFRWVYRLIDQIWTLEAVLQPSWFPLFADPIFGNNEAIGDDVLVVSGMQRETNDDPLVRVVTQFRFDGTAWQEYSTTHVDTHEPHPVSNVPLIALDGDVMVVWALHDDGVALVAYAGLASGDCDANGIPDGCDIAAGRLADIDLDGVPDSCDDVVLAGDLDGDGVVTGRDMVLLLAAWGPCFGPCPADLDGDGLVGDTDLAVLLAFWSPP